MPGPSNHRLTEAKASDKPWEKQRLKGDLLRERRIGGKEAPLVKSLEAAVRSPAPYGKEPTKVAAGASLQLLEEFCELNRVNLTLLFDTYGFRNYVNEDNVKEGVITGGELHRFIWDAGMLGVKGRVGISPKVADVDKFFERCVGSVYRESVRVSFDRFKSMLVRCAEEMSAQRNGVHPEKHMTDSCRDLVRDYLVPLCNANFWTESVTH